jgi:membrane protease YdiL (CAAX protease family)
MIFRKIKLTFIWKAVLCSIAFLLFSYFIHYSFPWRLVSFFALLVPTVIFAGDLRTFNDLKAITGGTIFKKKTLLYILSGIFLGILWTFLYRWHLDIRLLPETFFLFSLLAALIGSTEELVFRGFIQEYAKKGFNGLFSVFFGSLAHTGYKCALFLAPILTNHVDIGFLAFWTFAAGLISGALKHFSKSIWPSVAAHAVFDILVYAEYASAPWWVW